MTLSPHDVFELLSSSSVSLAFVESVLKRLDSFSLTLISSDAYLVAFAIQKVEQRIINNCATSSIPLGLMLPAVDRVCGDVLLAKYHTGDLAGFCVDSAIKQVSIGDTSVSFDSSQSTSHRFDALVACLIQKGSGDDACYRKLRW